MRRVACFFAAGLIALLTAGGATATVPFGPVEIRGFGLATEAVLTYPHPDLRLKNGTEGDHLASVRSMTNAAGARAAGQVYVPVGELVQIGAPLSPEETKGFIGERYDSDVGLQYLNAISWRKL